MLQAKEIIAELSHSGVTVHSSFVKDVELPMINLDWGATNRPVQYVDKKIQSDYNKLYGNPNSCGTLTGETARDIIDKTSEGICNHLKIDSQRNRIMYGGDGSSYWLDLIPRSLSKTIPLMEVVTLQEELHNSLLHPWMEGGFKIHMKKDMGWLEKYIQYKSGTPTKIVLLITLSSHLTGHNFPHAPLMELIGCLPREDRPIIIIDATCYLSHHQYIPHDLIYDFLCFSGHKFPGGPGSCGAMVVSNPYHPLIQVRGTPNVMSIVRLGLAVKVRSCVMKEGEESHEPDRWIRELNEFLETSERCHTRFVLHRWDTSLCSLRSEPVFSFSVYLTDLNKYIHPQVVSSILLNAFGIQIRAGGQCADYAVQKEGVWASLNTIDDHSPIMHPSICRISIPRYLLTKDLYYQVKTRLVDFLYVARFMIPSFYPRMDGWRLHPDYHKYVTLNEGRDIEFTGKSHYCGSCQENRDKMLYSTRETKKEVLKSGLEIYHLMDDVVLRHLNHVDVHTESQNLYNHPFRWFVHPLDDLSIDL
jgi:selenocysteine lyase/cysteine desulfurase